MSILYLSGLLSWKTVGEFTAICSLLGMLKEFFTVFLDFTGLKARSHGAAGAAIFLPQQMGCIGFNVSVHTAAAAATVLQINGFGTHFVQLQQWHHEGSPDSGTLKSLNFSNFWTF